MLQPENCISSRSLGHLRALFCLSVFIPKDAFPLFCNVHCLKNFFLIVSTGSLNLVPLNPFQPEQDFLIYDFVSY